MFGRDDNKVRINNAQITTYIGADTTVEGTVITKSSIRIDGTIIGGVCADGTIVLSESGQIQGNVMGENIVVAGVIDGNMQIRDKVNIEATGEVYGDITTNRILVDEESIFQGQCNMNRDKEKEKKRRKQGRLQVAYDDDLEQESNIEFVKEKREPARDRIHDNDIEKAAEEYVPDYKPEENDTAKEGDAAETAAIAADEPDSEDDEYSVDKDTTVARKMHKGSNMGNSRPHNSGMNKKNSYKSRKKGYANTGEIIIESLDEMDD